MRLSLVGAILHRFEPFAEAINERESSIDSAQNIGYPGSVPDVTAKRTKHTQLENTCNNLGGEVASAAAKIADGDAWAAKGNQQNADIQYQNATAQAGAAGNLATSLENDADGECSTTE
ncbi:hypothetical protein [Crateriforma conspicua]|uniref:hypothetical protein n=1 Tax=Crateriforma TaxID=2714592 RepID=UPI0011B7BDD3|nr:hypothetical protein [Crateriforma conspicua]